MKATNFGKVLAAGLSLVMTGGAYAATCSIADVTINQVGVATSSGTTWQAVSPISATECTGAWTGNAIPLPQQNIGLYQDGLFNGAKQPSSGTALFPNGIFPTQYNAVDLNHDGQLDPGWIYLGKWENGSFSPALIGGTSSIVLANWFSVTTNNGFSGTSGTWSFTPDYNVVSRVMPILGANLFDQFALSFMSGGYFSAYDFTANTLGLNVSPDTIYNFSGNWDMSGTLQNCHQQGSDHHLVCEPLGLSHVDLYVRDPNGGEIPEPASLLLIGAAFLGYSLSRRKAS